MCLGRSTFRWRFRSGSARRTYFTSSTPSFHFFARPALPRLHAYHIGRPLKPFVLERCPPMIRVICKCGFHGQVPANYVGKQVTCRKCGDVIAVSAEPTPPVPAANENPFGDVDSPGPSGDQARRRDAMAKHAGLMIFLGFGAILLGV